MARKKIQMGDKVKDTVTLLEGIVIGMSSFLHGCTRCCVQPQGLKDGKILKSEWVDEPQLQVVKPGAAKRGSRTTGGPMPSTPERSSDPS